MANSPDSSSDSTQSPNKHGYHPDYETTDADWRRFLMVVLLVAGTLAVCFAEGIGLWLVRRPSGNGGFQWNPGQARWMIDTVRTLGVMCFALGVVERVMIEIATLKK